MKQWNGYVKNNMLVMVGTDKGVNSATKLLTESCNFFETKCENLICKWYFPVCGYNKKKNYDDVLN